MKVLFISNELIGSGLCHRLMREGNDVKLYIHHKARKGCLSGIVPIVKNWRKELTWVGKEGLIIFDDVGFGSIQEKLRENGYNVFGGNAWGDKLELNRSFAEMITKQAGLKTLASHSFSSPEKAIEFVKNNKGPWVLKQSSHLSSLNLIGEKTDGSDIIDMLHEYKRRNIKRIFLQQKVSGVEVGIARYFNGKTWAGPIEINHEYKRLEEGEHGPLTAEMGTVIWHSHNESLPLFTKTLAKLKPYLKSISYRGDIDINCIVTKDDVWPLELTPRLGTPSTQLHCELFESSLAKFLSAVASGKATKPKVKSDYGVVVALGTPPFPYPPTVKSKKKKVLSFIKRLQPEENKSVYLEEISIDAQNSLYWSGEYGYIGYITASASTIREARRKAYEILKKISFPDLIYRTDIGTRVEKHDLPLLRKWGWM